MHAPGGPCRGVFGDLPSQDSEILTEMFPLKGGEGVSNPTPYVPPLSSLSHSLSSLHPLHPLDRNGDNIFQQSWTMCPGMFPGIKNVCFHQLLTGAF